METLWTIREQSYVRLFPNRLFAAGAARPVAASHWLSLSPSVHRRADSCMCCRPSQGWGGSWWKRKRAKARMFDAGREREREKVANECCDRLGGLRQAAKRRQMEKKQLAWCLSNKSPCLSFAIAEEVASKLTPCIPGLVVVCRFVFCLKASDDNVNSEGNRLPTRTLDKHKLR